MSRLTLTRFFSSRPTSLLFSLLAAITLAAPRIHAQTRDILDGDSTGFRTMIYRFTYPQIDIRVRYPMLLGKDGPAQRSLNALLQDSAHARLLSFKSQAFEGLRSMRAHYTEKHPGKRIPDSVRFALYATESFALWTVDSDLVSVMRTSEYFFGGAHPANEFHGAIWSLRGGKVRAVSSSELFRPGSDSLLREAYLRAAIGEEGKRPEPRFTADDLRTAVATGSIGEIATTGEGIVVMGWPLARVIGPVRVLIPFTEIAAIIDPNGPLGRFAAPGR